MGSVERERVGPVFGVVAAAAAARGWRGLVAGGHGGSGAALCLISLIWPVISLNFAYTTIDYRFVVKQFRFKIHRGPETRPATRDSTRDPGPREDFWADTATQPTQPRHSWADALGAAQATHIDAVVVTEGESEPTLSLLARP